jgi:putative endonuclease
VSLETREFGKRGELEAVRYLQRQGYRIVERNVRLGRGEIDLVAYDGKVLVFIEVKARRTEQFGGALWAVDTRKRAQLSHLALQYLTRRRLHDCICRFDVVLIQGRTDRKVEIQLIQNAFDAKGVIQ